MNEIFIVCAQWELESILPLAAFYTATEADGFSDKCLKYQGTEPDEHLDRWLCQHPGFPYLKRGDHLCGVDDYIVMKLPIDQRWLSGTDLIVAERTRQIEEEDFSPEHDDEHTDQSLAIAAACYAIPKESQKFRKNNETEDVSGGRGETPVWGSVAYQVPLMWPSSWNAIWWDSKTRIRDLTRSGALIAAEIDRLIRKDGFTCCPYCSSDVIYQDRVDAQKGVAHCDDCGQEIPGEVYRQIVSKEKV